MKITNHLMTMGKTVMQASTPAIATTVTARAITSNPAEAIEQSKAWASTLSAEQTALIRSWTGTGHRSMQPEQRRQLLDAIQTAPEYNGQAYRIIVEGSGQDGSLRSATMGDCFDLKLFYHYEGRQLRPRIIEIDLSNAPGKAIAGASTVPTEKEVLIEPRLKSVGDVL